MEDAVLNYLELRSYLGLFSAVIRKCEDEVNIEGIITLIFRLEVLIILQIVH